MKENFKFTDFMSEMDDKEYDKLESILKIKDRTTINIVGPSSKRKSKFVDLYAYKLNKIYGDKVLFITEKDKINEHLVNIVIKNHPEPIKDFTVENWIDVPKNILETFFFIEKKENMLLKNFIEEIKDYVKKHNINTVVIDSLSIQDFNFDDKPNYFDSFKSSEISLSLYRLIRTLNINFVVLKDKSDMKLRVKSEEKQDITESTATISKIDSLNGRKITYVMLEFK